MTTADLMEQDLIMIYAFIDLFRDCFEPVLLPDLSLQDLQDCVYLKTDTLMNLFIAFLQSLTETTGRKPTYQLLMIGPKIGALYCVKRLTIIRFISTITKLTQSIVRLI